MTVMKAQTVNKAIEHFRTRGFGSTLKYSNMGYISVLTID